MFWFLGLGFSQRDGSDSSFRREIVWLLFLIIFPLEVTSSVWGLGTFSPLLLILGRPWFGELIWDPLLGFGIIPPFYSITVGLFPPFLLESPFFQGGPFLQRSGNPGGLLKPPPQNCFAESSPLLKKTALFCVSWGISPLSLFVGRKYTHVLGAVLTQNTFLGA